MKRTASFIIMARPLLLMLAALLLAIAYISCDAFMQEKGEQVRELKADAAVIEKENADLKTEIARLSSAERIKEVAVNDLGMVPASTSDIVYYTTEKSAAKAEQQESNTDGHGIFSAFRRIFDGS